MTSPINTSASAVVTGAAGFIGSHLAESLVNEGWKVTAIDSFSDNYPRAAKERNLEALLDHDGFALISADITQAPLDQLFAEADVIFHLAAEPGVRPSWNRRFEAYVHNNVVATQHVLDAGRRTPDTPIIYGSSSSVYGQAARLPTPESVSPRPMSPYGVTKLTGEELCDAYAANFGLSVVVLRFFSVYGPRQRPDMAFHRFCRAALEGTPIEIYGDGTQTRDFTFVGDVVDAAKAAAHRPEAVGGIFNIGGGSRTSVRESLRLVGELTGRSLDVRYTRHMHGDVRDTGADTTQAQRVLAFEPATSLEDGLAAELDWVSASIVGEAPATHVSAP